MNHTIAQRRAWLRTRRGTTLALGAMLAAALAAGAQGAGASKHAPASAPTGLSAEQALVRLHQRAGVNIIADAGFAPASIDPKLLDGKDATRTVAEQLDCRIIAQPAKSHLVVLCRRFRQPDEMPQANPGELRQCASDMLRGLRVFDYPEGPPNESWSPLLKTLARMLTPEQVAVLERGQEIEITNLAPQQQRIAEQVMLSRAFGELKRSWELLSARLAVIDRGIFRARAATTGQPPLYEPILDIPGINTGSPVTFYPFPPDVSLERPTRSAASAAQQPQLTVSQRETPERGAGAARAGLDASVSPRAGRTTIGDLTSELTREAGVVVEAQSALRERRLVVAISDVRLRDVLDALASLYGWQWFRADNGQIVIHKPLPPLPKRPAEMGAFLRAALPADWRAFYAIRSIPDPRTLAKPTADQDGPDNSVPGPPVFSTRTQAATQRGLEAIARGFAAAGGPDHRVPFTALPSQDQEAVLLMLAASTFRTNDVYVWLDQPLAVPMDGVDMRLDVQHMKDSHGAPNGTVLMIYSVRGPLRSGFGTDIP